jgi:branched-chain amino acid transport system substrate-binding protein
MTKQKILWIAVVLLAIIAALGIIFIQWQEKENTIKIGAVLAMTGPGGYGGVDLRDAMLLAVEEVNKWGGVNGKRIELIIRDSKTNPKEGIKVFEKIEAAHHPLLYTSHLSSVSVALVPLAEKHKVAVVGLVATAPELTGQNDWVFRFYSRAEHEVPPIISILKDLQVNDLGIIYLDDEYGRGVHGLLKQTFQKTGGSVKSQVFPPAETDFKKYISALKDSQAIYVVGFGTHMQKIFKQLREEDFKGAVLASQTATWPPVREMPEAEGIYVASPLIFSPDFIFASELKQKYEARYNRTLTKYAANGYDFIKFLTGILEDKELTRQSVRELLEEKYIYTGVFGDLDIRPQEHEINFLLYPAQIINGQIRFID